MPFVDRDKAMNIVGYSVVAQRKDHEWLPDDHPDVIAFRATSDLFNPRAHIDSTEMIALCAAIVSGVIKGEIVDRFSQCCTAMLNDSGGAEAIMTRLEQIKSEQATRRTNAAN